MWQSCINWFILSQNWAVYVYATQSKTLPSENCNLNYILIASSPPQRGNSFWLWVQVLPGVGWKAGSHKELQFFKNSCKLEITKKSFLKPQNMVFGPERKYCPISYTTLTSSSKNSLPELRCMYEAGNLIFWQVYKHPALIPAPQYSPHCINFQAGKGAPWLNAPLLFAPEVLMSISMSWCSYQDHIS